MFQALFTSLHAGKRTSSSRRRPLGGRRVRRSALLVEPLEDRALLSLITYEVFPRDTDPAIDHPGSRGRHLAYLDQEVPSAGKLFVYFPGTNGVPAVSRYLLETAAALGYHAVGLTYVNDRSINFEICPGSTDPDCHKNVRMEIIDGTDRTPLVEVNRANSIENRLIKLLQYLDQQNPEEGWGQFLFGNRIRWRQMAFTGHSQGGGHAAILGKLHFVYRVGMFGATEPARWTTETLSQFPTPADRYYGFVHTLEDSYTGIVRSWNNLELPGALTSVDGAEPPFEGSHRLTTTVDVPPAARHGSTVTDRYTPLDDQGVPIFLPVWVYMLDPWGWWDGGSPRVGAGGSGQDLGDTLEEAAVVAALANAPGTDGPGRTATPLRERLQDTPRESEVDSRFTLAVSLASRLADRTSAAGEVLQARALAGGRDEPLSPLEELFQQ